LFQLFFSKGLDRIRTPGQPRPDSNPSPACRTKVQHSINVANDCFSTTEKYRTIHMVKKSCFGFFFERPRPDSNPRPACRIKVEHSINVANDCFSIAEKYRTIHGKKKIFRLFFSKGLGWIRTPDLRHSTNVANGDVPPTPYGLVPVASNFPRALSRIRYILDEFSIFV